MSLVPVRDYRVDIAVLLVMVCIIGVLSACLRWRVSAPCDPGMSEVKGWAGGYPVRFCVPAGTAPVAP